MSFFLPIMLMLFAAISKETGPAAIGALVVLEVIILDLAFTVSGTSASWEEGVSGLKSASTFRDHQPPSCR